MLHHPTIALIERRVSANLFDPTHAMTDSEIEYLVSLATRAPSAYNLQNWRFIAVRSQEEKARLCELAYGQKKVSQAAVTFIVCGQMPDPDTIVERLRPAVKSGHMPSSVALDWQDHAKTKFMDRRLCRDEAVRSATFAAATLIYAAEAMDLVSGPMTGFDVEGVTMAFGVEDGEFPVMLLPVGRPAPGNWPQKPRRPLSEVLEMS